MSETALSPASGLIPANPEVPCHECGTEERFMEIKRSDEWGIEYLDDGSGQWVAYCPECNVHTGTQRSEGDRE